MGLNAVTTVPVYTAGEVLTAADMNITNSGIPVFATSVTRDAAFGGSGEKTLAEGQACYIEGTGLQVYNGTAWRPYGYRQTFTPTFTNFTLGNGTVNWSHYTQIDDFIYCEVKVTLGSTSVMGSLPRMALPVTTASTGLYQQLGNATLLDEGSTIYQGLLYAPSGATTAEIRALNVGSTYASWADVTATVPFTWTTTDAFVLSISYTL
jgi:hypothetical protein